MSLAAIADNAGIFSAGILPAVVSSSKKYASRSQDKFIHSSSLVFHENGGADSSESRDVLLMALTAGYWQYGLVALSEYLRA